jgi:hypothetical protein
MIERRKLPKTKGKHLRVRWQDLPLGSDRLLPFDRHVGHLRDPLP